MTFYGVKLLFFNLEIFMGVILYIKNLPKIRISGYISQLYFNTRHRRLSKDLHISDSRVIRSSQNMNNLCQILLIHYCSGWNILYQFYGDFLEAETNPQIKRTWAKPQVLEVCPDFVNLLIKQHGCWKSSRTYGLQKSRNYGRKSVCSPLRAEGAHNSCCHC